ncbi:outer membrane beta-barrel protein [Flavobacterium sp. ZS1P14]|uniref:outer membrane beta-barrel protein n=1 Tax=Flavobacterium sp. ZS1P14 TaxID=3401729 RepID=UPI003AB0BFA8
MKKNIGIKNNIIALCLFISGFGYGQNETPKDSISNKLSEVIVSAPTKLFTNKNGNSKVDIANSIYNSIPNTIDLIAKLPNIQVSVDKENITVIGKGNPLLYIDNQKVGMNDLNTLAVDDIKTIEIISNPSSKFEAAGRAVILITRKFSKKEGFQTIVSEVASFKKYFNNYLEISASLKKNKLEFKTNFNYNQIKVWESNGNDFMIPSRTIISNYLATAVTKRPQFIFGGGIFYKINEVDYWSLNFSRRTQKDIFDILTDTYNQQQSIINRIRTLNLNDEYRNFSNGYINYNHKIKSVDGILFSGFQYSRFNQQVASTITNNYNNTSFELSQNRNQKISIAVFSGKSDFEKEFGNKMKLELGTLYLQADSNTNFLVENVNPSITINSDYNYNETNIAAYSQLSGSVKKVKYFFGLRAENTIAKGKYQAENSLLIDKNYINLFPKATIEIPMDSTNTINLNYAKSISRPNFSTTSQVSAYINPYFVWSNNINLDPTITDEVAVSYQYGDKSVKVSCNKIINPVYYGSSYDSSQNVLTLKTTNFEKETGFNLEFSIPFKYKFWTTTNTLNFILSKIEDKQAIVNDTKPYLYYYSNHSFKLPKEIKVSLTGWGLTRQQQGIFERSALFTIDFAISNTLFKQFDCTISYNDIFRQMKYHEDFTINNITAKGIYYTDANLVSFSIKYSFGKIKNTEFKEKNIDENSSRIR